MKFANHNQIINQFNYFLLLKIINDFPTCEAPIKLCIYKYIHVIISQLYIKKKVESSVLIF